MSGEVTKKNPLESLDGPSHLNWNHQDSVFANTFQAKSNFVINPEWLSESIDNPGSEPLSRAPWPWEQPRYRINLQPTSAQDTLGKDKDDAPGVGDRLTTHCTTGELTDGTESDKASPVTQAMYRQYLFTHPSPQETDVLHHTNDILIHHIVGTHN